MRSPGAEALCGTAHFGKLIHQAAFGVQTASGVHDDVIGLTRLGCLQCIEEHRRGVAPWLVLDHLSSTAVTPDLQLLDRSSTKCVSRCQQHSLALSAQGVCQLANGGCLACAIHADYENHFRLPV